MSAKVVAYVLAGGRGERLAPVIGDLPKALAPVKGRPMLAYTLDTLAEVESVDDVVVCLGYGADKVRAAFGPRYGRLSLSFHEDLVPGEGIAVAVRRAVEWWVDCKGFTARADDAWVPILVVNGDTLWPRGVVRDAMQMVARPPARGFGVFYGESMLEASRRRVPWWRKGVGRWVQPTPSGFFLMTREVARGLRGPGGLEGSLGSLRGPRVFEWGLPWAKPPRLSPYLDIGTPEGYALGQVCPWIRGGEAR